MCLCVCVRQKKLKNTADEKLNVNLRWIYVMVNVLEVMRIQWYWTFTVDFESILVLLDGNSTWTHDIVSDVCVGYWASLTLYNSVALSRGRWPQCQMSSGRRTLTLRYFFVCISFWRRNCAGLTTRCAVTHSNSPFCPQRKCWNVVAVCVQQWK